MAGAPEMNAAGLIAVTTLECAGWLPTSDPGRAYLKSVELHEQLLGIVRSSMRWRRSGDEVRAQLMEAINAASLKAIQGVPSAIEAVRSSGASYLMEFDGWDGLVRERYTFKQLPFIGEAERSFRWMAGIRRLPRGQQFGLIQLLGLEFDECNTLQHLTFAKEDGDLCQQAALKSELAALRQQVEKVLARLSAKAVAEKECILQSLHHIDLQYCPPVVEADVESRRAEILTVATAMDRAGDSLIQPMPLAAWLRSTVSRRATVAWDELCDLRSILHVLAIWLRALADDGDAKTCALCYRHLGYRGKAFCAVHQRQGGKRQPAREFHIAESYLLQVEHLVRTEPKLKEAIAGADKLGRLAEPESKVELPAGFCVPEPLIQPALTLFGSLARVSPATGSELGRHVHELFGRLVRIAAEPYSASGQHNHEDVLVGRIRQEQSRRWLTWTTFFRAWYGEQFGSPGSSTQDLQGKAFDIDHPLVHGRALPPGELVVDLLRQRAWTWAEREIDTHAYVGMHGITRMHAQKKSLRTIAEALGVHHETVRQTLKYSSGQAGAGARRLRMIPAFKAGKLPKATVATRRSK